MVIWLTFFIFAGIAGLALNRILYVLRSGNYPGWFFLISLVVAIVVGLAGVRVFARLAAKVVDTGGKSATPKSELAGRLGVVASSTIDERFGEVRVHDEEGNEILVHGRVASGEAPIGHGERVVLVEYDSGADLFVVSRLPEVES